MKSPFLHMIDPASVLAAARRLQTVAPATRQGGRNAAAVRRVRNESDPEVDDILAEIEARQSDEGDFDAFLERIGAMPADATFPDKADKDTTEAAAAPGPDSSGARPDAAGRQNEDAHVGDDEVDDDGDPRMDAGIDADEGADMPGDISGLVDTSDLQDTDPDAPG